MRPDVSHHAVDRRDPVRLSLVSGANTGQAPTAPVPPPQARTVQDAVQLYESTHLPTLKHPGPVRGRLRYLSAFNERTLESLTVVELQQFFNRLAASSGPASAYNTLKTLRHLYRKMMQLQQYQGLNPAVYVQVKRPCARSVYLNELELSHLFRVLSYYPSDERLFFTALVTLFCRFSELKMAKVEAFSFWIDKATQQRRCLWRKGRTKNGRHHEVPLPPQLSEELWTYLDTRRRKDSPWLFPGCGEKPRSQIAWWNRWNEIRSEAGLDHVHIHDLRRTGSTWAVETTGDLTTVSRDGLQHADLKTTSIYVQSTGKKALQMFTAHEQALKTQLANTQPDASPVPRPHPSSEISAPAAVVTSTPPQTFRDDEGMEWPG